MSLAKEIRAVWDGPFRRLLIVRWMVCGGLLSGIALSPRLWMTERGFPTIPAIRGLPDLPQPLCLLLSAFLVLSLLVVAVLPRPHRLVFAPVAIAGLLILFDINRLQPWLYLYMLLLLPVGGDSETKHWANCAFIFAATYFWSGAQKLNVGFVREVFPWMLRPLTSADLGSIPYAVAVIEASIGVLLLIPRTRKLALVGLVLMHALLLLLLGIGKSYNSVVWPWNFWMPAIGCALFWRNSQPLFPTVTKSRLGIALIVLVGVLPALNFAGWWDDSLSASLYAGRTRYAVAIIPIEDASRFPATAIAPLDATHAQLKLVEWPMAELNVPPYPETWVFRAVAEKTRATDLLIRDRPPLLGELPKFRRTGL